MPENQIKLEQLKKSDLTALYKLTNSSQAGLTTKEAIKRSRIFGYNQIAATKKRHPFIKFISYFKNPLVILFPPTEKLLKQMISF